jgi:hypothetical protein
MPETRPSAQLTPATPFTDPKFDWSSYLQRHLTSPGVVVSTLHPIMGLRVAALFITLTAEKLASDEPGAGIIQILSGVRTKAQQTALFSDICLRQKRCAYVANPNNVHGPDEEGTVRQGSNHQAQRQTWSVNGVPAEVGYAVDLRNQAGSDDAAWKPVHDRLAKYGLDWPLKTGAIERWHMEAFPRRVGWLEGPWPQRPGIHRKLSVGHRGGDVELLQQQVNNEPVDGIFGRGLEADVRAAQTGFGLMATGTWGAGAQTAYEASIAPPAPEPPPVIVIPPAASIAALTERARSLMDELEATIDQIDDVAAL